MKDPLFGGSVGDEFILKAPPVRRLYAIYGTTPVCAACAACRVRAVCVTWAVGRVPCWADGGNALGINLDTEVGYVFKREKSGSLALDDNPPPSKNGLQNDGFVFKKGIVYETSRSKQGIVREMTGVDGFTCGDGTGTVTPHTHHRRVGCVG